MSELLYGYTVYEPDLRGGLDLHTPRGESEQCSPSPVSILAHRDLIVQIRQGWGGGGVDGGGVDGAGHGQAGRPLSCPSPTSGPLPDPCLSLLGEGRGVSGNIRQAPIT